MTAVVEGEADLALNTSDGDGLIEFFVRVGDDDWLWFQRGELTTKDPRPPLIRRIVEIGHLLDAWFPPSPTSR